MDRWYNKVAVVTGASSGIGQVVAADLVKHDFRVVALARRTDRLLENKLALQDTLRARYHIVNCNVTNEEEVKCTFEWIEKTLGGTDVLINNAGIICRGTNLSSLDSTKPARDTLDTNVMGVFYCVREAFNSMKKRNFDGHVVIVNSIGGHKVPIIPGISYNMYCATKYAVTAMVETYRQEFADAGTKVKVTSISPGIVDTEIIRNKEAMKNAGVPFLNPEDVSNAILYVLGTPPHVQVHELMIKPVGETF
ncbi:unnamed protein product [Hermetia illucens]|uniref:Farnesol dehydrogenase n=1 Tax=Hermetia illucens TaxID=343691 RepID=A0A7R8UE68_HERIL|nr:farnesol dehydrogenase-like [Hermetia illucens]CAD7079044.1 unnamed protein product [Hermetia illucens]